MGVQTKERVRIAKAVGLCLSALFGIGWFGQYPAMRELALKLGITSLPESQPYYTSIIVVLGLIAVVLTLAFRKLHRTAPRLFFESPRTSGGPLYQKESKRIDMANRVIVVKQLCMVRVAARNRPVSAAGGESVDDAFCIAQFFDSGGGLLFDVEHPRWDENRKPRPDEFPDFLTPRFLDPMNYRELKPNDAKHNITFAIKNLELDECFGFAGSSQDDYEHNWQSPQFALKPGTYYVRLTIKGSGLRKPAIKEFRLVNGGAGHPLLCEPSPLKLS